MGLSLSLRTGLAPGSSGFPDWLPSGMFPLSQQGVWYDFSDLSTMFQDAAGTTPVTALGQPVGLILDKRLWGGKTFAQVMAGQPELVSNPGGPFITTDDWARQDLNTTLSVDAGRLRLNFVSESNYAWAPISTVAGQTYYVDIAFELGSNATAVGISVRDATVGGTVIVHGASSNQTATSPIRFFFVALSSISVLRFEVTKTNPATAFMLSASAKLIPGNHARQTTSASRPIWQEDANGARGLKFDGVDDWLVTPSIDFSASDKMLVSAGVRKLSDALRGMLVELGNNSTYAFQLNAPDTPFDYSFGSRGTASAPATTTGFDAPISNVLTGVGDISGDIARLRVNGAQIAENTNDQGTGNYGNYPLYIGRRGGTSLSFNGFIHQLVVRGGALPSADELAQLEAFIAGKSGVIL